MDKLSELKAAAMAATPGPWFVHEKPCEDGNYGIDTSDNEWAAEAVVWWGFARESIWREEDARFIAAANPAAVLALLAELEAKDKRIAELSRLLAHNIERAEKAEKRLATPVRLPDIEFVKISGIDFPVMRADIVKKEIRRAGFTVEGDE